jgi:farnesol dehydrogenase
MSTGRVFLTGGTGFFGGELLRQLSAAGYLVRMLARQSATEAPPPGVEVVQGDLSDTGRLTELMSGCRAVFHTAALVASWVPNRTDFYRTNVEGLVHVQEACEGASVGTLIYTSSFFALGPSGLPGANENAPYPVQGRHPYEHSKTVARKIARSFRESGFPIVILYPGIIYGPGRRTQGNLVAQLLSDFKARRTPGLLGDGSQVWSFAYVKDVARGHILALEHAATGGEFVLGGDNISLREFFSVAASLMGKAAPRLKIPPWLGATAAAAEFSLARLTGRPPTMTPASVRLMYDSWALDSARARHQLGYNCTSLKDGLAETVRSLEAMDVRQG